MTLLDRLKPEYKEKLNYYYINILSNNKYYIDLSVLDANSICYELTGKSIELGLLQSLFYEIKEMKNE